MPDRRRRAASWLLATLCAVTAARLVRTDGHGGDFHSFYFAFKAAAQGGDPYDTTYLNDLARQHGVSQRIHPYLYPPFLAFAGAPLSRLRPRSAYVLWTLASLALLPVIVLTSAAFVLAKLPAQAVGTDARSDPALQVPLMGVLLLSVLPFANNIEQGQANIIVLALMSSSLFLHSRGRDGLAGALLGAAILIKPSPLLLLPFFLAKRRHRVIVSCVAAMALLSLSTAPLGGLRCWPRFLALLPAVARGGVPGLFPIGAPFNFSLAAFFSRLLPGHDDAAGIAACGAALLLLAAGFAGVRKAGAEEGDAGLLAFLVLVVIAPPLAYIHHVVILYPGALLSLSSTPRGRPARGTLFLAPLLALAIAGFNFPDRLYWRLAPLSPLVTSLNLYALLALYALTFSGFRPTRDAPR